MTSIAVLKEPSWEDLEERQRIFSGKRSLKGPKSEKKGVDADPNVCFQKQNQSVLCVSSDVNDKTTCHYDTSEGQPS